MILSFLVCTVAITDTVAIHVLFIIPGTVALFLVLV